jgi:hypothetical protein
VGPVFDLVGVDEELAFPSRGKNGFALAVLAAEPGMAGILDREVWTT